MPGYNIAADIREVVSALQGFFASPQQATLDKDVMADLAKFGISSGMQPYDLAEYAVFLQPTFSPLRNMIPRIRRRGRNFEAKSVTNVDVNNVSGIATEGQLAPAIATQFADVTTYFMSYGISSDPVTMEQLFAGEGNNGDFSIDSRAVAVANLLKGLFIKEERLFLGGVGSTQQVFTVNNGPVNGINLTFGGAMGNAPAGGTLTTGTTGGTIPASTTVYALYTAVSAFAIPTGMPTNQGAIAYSKTTAGQSLPQTAQLSVETGSGGGTNTVVFTPPAYTGPVPVIGWVLYLGASANGPFYFAGFTTGAPLTVTSVPTNGLQAPTIDQTASVGSGPNGLNGSFNGILSWIFAQGSNATIQAVNGTLTLDDVNTAFSNAFTNQFANPDHLYCSALDIQTLTKLLTGNNGGQPYWFAAQQGNAQGEMTANFRVSRYLNPVTSKIIPVDVHAYLPQGIMLGITEQLPDWYVGNNVPDVWTWVGAMDYLEIDYQPISSNPQWISEIRNFGALHCFLPSQNLAITGINAPAAA
ncbi:SU10 major capsid protein [Alicyclobacillus fastidiosus]|uniref:Phage major capsid protein n=1 Tax=Alicyclobacillus fastidiosus TaxID=392011 RepID=A0ABV5ALR2_9BACL|nr:hypothetical protein [Alicyclobacillus fastidiosus]WEH08484.1 hypothetical protein PYS47_17580 [Alicyclobacillus fastidiosus]